jgi:hypothetical protein
MNLQIANPKNRGKRARAKTPRPAEPRLGWMTVLAALPRPAARSFVLSRFKSLGFYATSWEQRFPREEMARILTACEDWMELTHGRPAWASDRERVRLVRQRLELELWP